MTTAAAAQYGKPAAAAGTGITSVQQKGREMLHSLTRPEDAAGRRDSRYNQVLTCWNPGSKI
jgi:hypothetical protein